MKPGLTSLKTVLCGMVVVTVLGLNWGGSCLAATNTAANKVTSRSRAGEVFKICVLPFGNRDETDTSGWMSLALPDMFIDVLTQSRDIMILDRREIDSVLNEQSLWAGGMVQEQWAKSTNLVDRADIALYGSFLLEGSNVSVEVHAIDVTSRRVSAAITYSGTRNDLPKWVGKASADLLRQLCEGYTGLESMLQRIPQRSLACLEHFYSGQIAAEAGDRNRATTHLLKASAMDPSLAGGHYWLARTFESWEEKDHALLHYIAIAGSNINIQTVTVEMRDTYDRLFEAGITNRAFDAIANFIRADPTWYDGIRDYLGPMRDLPTGVPYINYLPASTSSVFGLMLSSNSVSTAKTPLRYPVDYEMWTEEFVSWEIYEKERTAMRENLKDAIFRARFPCFVFAAPPGHVIVAATFKQQRQMGWCVASLWDYSHCMGKGNIDWVTPFFKLKPDIRRKDSYRNFAWGGRLDRPYKVVFVTGADETVPAEVVFETVPESEVAVVDLDTGRRKMDHFSIIWPDRFSNEKPPCFMYVNPGRIRFVVQGTWSEVGVDPTNNSPATVECYGNAVCDWEWSKGQVVRLDHSLHLTTKKYTPIPGATVYSADDQRLVDQYVTSGIGWRSIRTPDGSRPAVMSLVQPYKDTIVACWQPPLTSVLPKSGTELLVTIFKDGMIDTEVRQVVAPGLPVLRGMRLRFAPATEDYVLVCTPKDSTDTTRDICLRSRDLRTWTRCSVQSIAGEKLVGNDSDTAASLWELHKLGPIRRQMDVESLGRAVCDYNSWFGDAVYCVELLMGSQHALVCYRADAEVHRLKVAQRQAIQDAKDRAANRTYVEECRLAAKTAKEKGIGSAEFRAAVLKAAPGFRQVPVYTKPGEGTFQTYSLNDVRQGLDGFRFRMPKEPGLDFAWLFAIPRGVTWYIVPIDGSLKNGFSHFQYFGGEFKDFSVAQDWLAIVQTLPADDLEPGKEYAIWFQFGGLDKMMIPAGLAAIPDPMNYTCKDTIEGVEVSFKRGQALAYVAGFQPPVTNAQTLLDYAVKRQDITMVKTALERGAQYAKSPFTLLVAAKTKNVKLLQELLKTGLQKQTWHVKSSQTAGLWLPEDTETGMVSALFLGDIGPEMIEFLVRECGADVGLVVKTRFYGTCTALDYAARMGSAEECAKLIELGAKVSDYTIKMAKDHGMTDKIQLLEKARTK